jgi:hypothetical protein
MEKRNDVIVETRQESPDQKSGITNDLN